MGKQIRIGIWIFAAVCGLFFLTQREVVLAEEENAKVYYEEYGRALFFEPLGNTTGNIYYVTAEKWDRYTYRNLAWCMVVKDQDGTEIERVPYKLGGHIFPLVDARYTEDYMIQFQLFRLNIKEMKRQLAPETLEKLEAGQCTITVDGCLVRKKDGVDQGYISEFGETTGELYFTYEEVKQSALFTEAEKADAAQYFNREVKNLFCQIKTEAGEGIKEITGGGNYCYGDRVKLTAEVEDGYRFAGWEGILAAATKSITFRAKESGTYKAKANYDKPPVISASDRYYPASWIAEGRITEEFLASGAKALDQEDGEILYGKHGRKMFGFLDFSENDFDSLQKGGSVTETLIAVDSGGNQTEKTIKIHFVDTGVRTGRDGDGIPRLIRENYYRNPDGTLLPESEGGLPSDSCWVILEDYQKLLRKALGIL